MNYKILMVDDDRELLKMLNQYFTLKNYTVMIAENGIEAMEKTIKVKEILKRGEIKTINEAVERMGLSRSAYYKYKDYVFPFYEASKEKIITLSLLLEHKAGVLSRVLNTVASDSGSIMTINQGIPLQGVANTTISIETKDLTIDLEALLDKLRMIDGVKRLEVLGQV